MKLKWDTPEKRAALREKYNSSPSYISHMFKGSKPPCYWVLIELGYNKVTEVRYVRT